MNCPKKKPSSVSASRLVHQALFYCLGSVACFAQDMRQPPSEADIAGIVAEGFSASRDRLGLRLMDAYQPGTMGVSGSSGNAAFQKWLNLWRWAELLSRSEETEAAALVQRHLYTSKSDGKLWFVGTGESSDKSHVPLANDRVHAFLQSGAEAEKFYSRVLRTSMRPDKDDLSQRLRPEFLISLLRDAPFSQAFFQILQPSDYASGVLLALQQTADADPAKWASYKNLAIALAVVHDVAPPAFWPHHQVSTGLVPREETAIGTLFRQWIAANENRQLLFDLRLLSPEQLKFVVDAPIAESELEWARKNVKLPRASFEKVFSQVNYSFQRITDKAYTWDTDPYLLKTLLARGGICVDQAYFAMLAGKARGLPTLFFTGQGADGGHAWFGFMKSDDRWELDAGRYENQNYSVGEALDPQTWTPISDYDLRFLVARSRTRPDFVASMNDLTLARLFEDAGNAAMAARASESAVRTCPSNPSAWAAQGAALQQRGARAAERKSFHEAALKQFASDRDQRTLHQQALAALARSEGDTETADRLERLIVLQNRRKRSDLSVNVAAEKIAALVDAEKFDAAAKEFRTQINTLGATGGGNLFFDVVAPYVLALVDAGKKPDAQRAIALARKALSPEAESLLSQAFDDLAESAK